MTIAKTTPSGRVFAVAFLAVTASLLPIRLGGDLAASPFGAGLALADQGSGSGGSGGGSGSGNSGSGGGGSGNSGPGGGGNSGPGGGNTGSGNLTNGHHVGDNGAVIEVDGDNIEIIYPDGWKEELEGNRYELKDPYGRTVIERPATPDDRARMEAVL